MQIGNIRIGTLKFGFEDFEERVEAQSGIYELFISTKNEYISETETFDTISTQLVNYITNSTSIIVEDTNGNVLMTLDNYLFRSITRTLEIQNGSITNRIFIRFEKQ